MAELTPGLHEKFLRFHRAFKRGREILILADVKGATLAKGPWDAAMKAVPLRPDELRFYKKLVSIQSVNGGEPFQLGPLDDLEKKAPDNG